MRAQAACPLAGTYQGTVGDEVGYYALLLHLIKYVKRTPGLVALLTST